MQLCILCGGKGTRLGTLAEKTPKALMSINGKPFIEILIEEYRKVGFNRFILLTGHLGNKLEKYNCGNIRVIREKKELGTGGAILDALPHLDKHFYVANGDTFIKAEDLLKYIIYSKDNNSSLISKDKHAGLFSFNKDTLQHLKENVLDYEKNPSQLYSLERDVIKGIRGFHYYVGKGDYHDIGTPERLEAFKKVYKRKALFIDRDGTIIKHVPYIKNADQVELILHVVKKMEKAQKLGYLLLLVSNQAGIEKGIMTKKEFNEITKKMNDLLAWYGIFLDKEYYCFTRDDAHPDRKPNPGMLIQAQKDWNLDMSQCVMVGDRAEIDIEAGKRAGIPRLYLTKDFHRF